MSLRCYKGDTQLFGYLDPTEFLCLLKFLLVLKASESMVFPSSKRERDDFCLVFRVSESCEASVLSCLTTAWSILYL